MSISRNVWIWGHFREEANVWQVPEAEVGPESTSDGNSRFLFLARNDPGSMQCLNGKRTAFRQAKICSDDQSATTPSRRLVKVSPAPQSAARLVGRRGIRNFKAEGTTLYLDLGSRMVPLPHICALTMLVCLLVPSTAIRQSLGVAAVLGSCTRHDGLPFDALGPIGTRERAAFDCRRRKLEWVPLLAEVIDHLLQTDFRKSAVTGDANRQMQTGKIARGIGESCCPSEGTFTSNSPCRTRTRN